MSTEARNHIDLRIIAQDPSVKGDDDHILTAQARVPWSRLEPGPKSSRFHVVDFNSTTSTLLTHDQLVEGQTFEKADDDTLRTDPAFHAQQVYAVAARTLAQFEFALGRRLPWGFSGHQLFLVPHAFAEANAYYSMEDRALLFGYVPTQNGPNVYTCLSHDVVVHETTHAILDGMRRRFLEPGLPDQAAFHEGFADIVALLSVFSLPPVVEQCLGKADEDGRIPRRRLDVGRLRRGVLTGVAEQLGEALTHGRGALRQSALEPPPADWKMRPEFQEPHRRGEILVSVVLDVLVELWHIRLKPLLDPDKGRPPATVDRERAAEEGALAATHLMTMLIRGLDYLPPVEFEFPDLVDAIMLADEQIFPDDDLGYRARLEERFAETGVRRPAGRTVDLVSGDNVPSYHGVNFAALRTDRNEVFRFLWQNAPVFGLDTDVYTAVESVWPSQRVGPDGLIVVESVANYVQMLDLTAAELSARSGLPLPADVPDRTPVQIFGGGTLVFDQFGRAKLHIAKPIDDWSRQLRRVAYLARAGIVDTDRRLGFSDGSGRGQAFAALHSTELGTGEVW